MRKRLFSILLIFIMVVATMPAISFASSADIIVSDTGEDGLTWKLFSDGTLTISGNGKMDDIESGYADGTGYYPITWAEAQKTHYMKWHNGYADRIKSVVIGENVTSIGQYAFYNCKNLVSVSLHENLKIGAYSFYGCSSLTEITIPDGCELPGLSWNINGTSYAFQNCTRLKSLKIGDNVNISSQAVFMGCTALNNVTLGDGTRVSSSAFKNCKNISSLKINTGTIWDYDAFLMCEKIKKVDIFGSGAFKCVVVEGQGYRPWIASSLVITDVVVEEGVTELDQGLFYYNGSGTPALTNVTLPKSLKRISSLCFYNCKSIQEITVPKAVESIGDNAFYNVNAVFNVYRDSFADTYLTKLGKNVQYMSYSYCIDDDSVSISPLELEYDGVPKTPNVRISLNDEALIENIDYSITFSNNVYPGTATATIVGKGKYYGTVTKTFTITHNKGNNIIETDIELSQDEYIYDGFPKTPTIEVKLDDLLLVENRDYLVSYSNNIYPGTAKVTLVGIGRVHGTITKTFTINGPQIYINPPEQSIHANILTMHGHCAEPGCYFNIEYIYNTDKPNRGILNVDFPYIYECEIPGATIEDLLHSYGECFDITEVNISVQSGYYGMVLKSNSFIDMNSLRTFSISYKGEGTLNLLEIEENFFDKNAQIKKITTEGINKVIYADCPAIQNAAKTGSAFTTTHDFNSKITKQPTCTETGKKRCECKKCGYIGDYDIPALGHLYSKELIKPATCEEEGQLQLRCLRDDCGYEAAIESIPALGHLYSKKVIKPATCEEEGQLQFHCLRDDCGHYAIESIPALGHDLQVVDRIESTCSSQGNIKHLYCERCQKHFADNNVGDELTELAENQYVIKQQHKLSHHEAKESTDTEPGNIEYWYCYLCNKYFIHDYDFDNSEVTRDELSTLPKDVQNWDIKLINDEYYYDGNAKTPAVIIKGALRNVDYQVSYLNNIELGEATVLVEGIGVYNGSQSIRFNIVTETDAIYSGICGENAEWELQRNGVLIIKGDGEMDSWATKESTPWSQYCSEIKQIIIDEGIVNIGSNAFGGCKKLETVSLPDTLKSIEKRALYHCPMLSSLELPSKIERLEENAIAYCGIDEITIPDSVTCFQDGAVDSEQNITVYFEGKVGNIGKIYRPVSIVVPRQYVTYYLKEQVVDDPKRIRTDDNHTVLGFGNNRSIYWYLLDDKVLHFYGNGAIDDFEMGTNAPWKDCANDAESLVIHEGITKIGNRAFEISKFKSVTFPDSLTYIGDHAFTFSAINDRSNVTSIVIPENVKHIGECALPPTLKKIIVDEGNLYYDSRNESNAIIETMTNKLALGCTNTIIPDGVEIIGERAFEGFRAPAKVSIPNSVSVIEKEAFFGSDLEEIVLNNGIRYLGDDMLMGCSSLKKIKVYCNPPEIQTNALQKSLVELLYDCSNSLWDDKTRENWHSDIYDWKTNHNLINVPYKEATCTENGNPEYFTCTICGLCFDSVYDRFGIKDGAPIYIEDHKPDFICAVESTTTHTGNTEYWKCSVCNKCFLDPDCNFEIDEKDCATDIHKHVFDQEVAEDEYLKTAADCMHSAVYIKSCVCGEAGTETFTLGIALGHDWNVVGEDGLCTCKNCDAVKNGDIVLEKNEITPTQALIDKNLDTKRAIINALNSAISGEFDTDNVKLQYLDISLGSAAETQAQGTTILIPYSWITDLPDGITLEDLQLYHFVIVHMKDSGVDAGQTEILTPTVTAAGLEITVDSFSPFAIGFEVKSGMLGDFNNDFHLTVEDLAIFKQAMLTNTLSGDQRLIADITQNGTVDYNDAIMLRNIMEEK